MARVLSGYWFPGLWVRLLALQRLLLVQSESVFGSAGQLQNGAWVFVCSDPLCDAGTDRVRTVSSNATQMCCARPMDSAVYRQAEEVGQLGTLMGETNLDVFICIGCVASLHFPNFAIAAAAVNPGQPCPQCELQLLVKFGTSRKS